MYDFSPILRRLKEAKKRANCTNYELSEKSGVSLGTINKILSGGTTEPKLPAMMAIAKALGVSVDWLVYGNRTYEETCISPELERVSAAFDELNEEGVEKILDYVDDVVASGRYQKNNSSRLDQEA